MYQTKPSSMSGMSYHIRRVSSTDIIMKGLNISQGETITSNDDLWQSLQSAMLEIFKARVDSPLPDVNVAHLNETCRRLMRADSRNTIFSRFEDTLLIKCFIIVRDSILSSPINTFLDCLAIWWTRFYHRILPLVCIIFTPVPTFGLTVRQMCLKVFRDVILSKIQHRLKDSLGHEDGIPIEVVQMLLTLQSVPETVTESYRQTEELSGLLIRPYLQNMKAIGEQLDQELTVDAHPPSVSSSHFPRRASAPISGMTLLEYGSRAAQLDRDTPKLGPVNESRAVM
ncbi:uncharacterized protein LOC135813654 [Sycon ciliatum]|uniref:uncharacterized protein LOC135813654 n=1 Tax=Sycon ciliatum TaxID=27933 RepID=UPI0020A8418F|eukprot:scpid66756/ scgid4037/ Proline-rich protein 5-like; Protein observed with Rictor-2